MTIASEIQRIKNNIANAYDVCTNKGANIPSNKNSSNLANCINSITVGSGSGSNVDLKPLVKKALGWTNPNEGKCYFALWNKDGTYNLMSASFKTLVKNFATNYMGSYTSYILDGCFYLRQSYSDNYIKCNCNITDWIGYSSVGTNGFAIRENGSLYYYDLSPNGTATVKLTDDTGVWTKLASYYYSGTYGIRNGELCKAIPPSTNTYTVIDNSGTWTDVCCLSFGISGYGIKDGKVYHINISSGATTQLSNETGFTAVSGDSYGLAICNGALYYLNGTSNARLLDNTQTWVKLCGSQNAITSTGKLYCSSYGSSIQQVGTDTGWTDACGQNSNIAIGLNRGNVYWQLSNNNLKQITFDGDITQIDGVINTMSEKDRTCAVMVSSNSSNQNLYSVAYPNPNYSLYFDKNLTTQFPIKINSISNNSDYIEVLPLINGVKQKYYRNTNIDGNFSVTPDEHKRTEELINILEGS
ncbi:MAG: hypothetical protein VZR09_10495 [Candidatus Gastranaerophilaceae bacterium]|nr:hypothetical protein [Candidatus Gastranaerophilaceae bacterium]